MDTKKVLKCMQKDSKKKARLVHNAVLEELNRHPTPSFETIVEILYNSLFLTFCEIAHALRNLYEEKKLSYEKIMSLLIRICHATPAQVAKALYSSKGADAKPENVLKCLMILRLEYSSIFQIMASSLGLDISLVMRIFSNTHNNSGWYKKIVHLPNIFSHAVDYMRSSCVGYDGNSFFSLEDPNEKETNMYIFYYLINIAVNVMKLDTDKILEATNTNVFPDISIYSPSSDYSREKSVREAIELVKDHRKVFIKGLPVYNSPE